MCLQLKLELYSAAFYGNKMLWSVHYSLLLVQYLSVTISLKYVALFIMRIKQISDPWLGCNIWFRSSIKRRNRARFAIMWSDWDLPQYPLTCMNCYLHALSVESWAQTRRHIHHHHHPLLLGCSGFPQSRIQPCFLMVTAQAEKTSAEQQSHMSSFIIYSSYLNLKHSRNIYVVKKRDMFQQKSFFL